MPTRRDLLRAGGAAVGALVGGCSRDQTSSAREVGVVVGEPTAEAAGLEVLAAGGNAVDAIVAAALTAGVVALPSCGIGGYGGSMTLGFADGRVTSIDFNTLSPAALTEDSFRPDGEGNVPGRVNQFGWLAAGVPGTLAGMQLALDRYGTRSFAEAVKPAINHGREGFPVSAGLVRSLENAAEQLLQDPVSAKLLFPGGKPLVEGSVFRNPELADLLDGLAEHGSAEPFYRGAVAAKIAEEFKKNGGIATVEDFAAHRAQEVEPVRLEWHGDVICTAPLTSGGTTIIETLSILKALDWAAMDDPFAQRHAQLEAMRIAWDDRLKLFGDLAHVDAPVERLLSSEYAEQSAARVRQAVADKRPLEIEGDWLEQVGTIHLSAADSDGNMAALTLTHGGGFGARVTVEGLGLILGHGMSRFDPRPGKANSPGPRKRPLHNMCPTVVMRGGKPALAVGARGGRRIPNAVLATLLSFCGFKESGGEAIDAPRMHTESGMRLTLDDRWSVDDRSAFRGLGYEVDEASVATASATYREPTGDRLTTAQR